MPDKEVPEYKLGTADGGKAAEKCAVRNILTGIFTVIPPSADNHGPVRVAGTYYLAYEDGTPYHCIGTTCYVWNLQNEELQKQTLKTLEEKCVLIRSVSVFFLSTMTTIFMSRLPILMREHPATALC